MAFIKVQNLKKDGNGTVIGGTASIIDVEYVAGGRVHSKQKPREPLGKVVWIAENRRKGIFLSRTRGLVAYDADEDEFSTVEKDDARVPGDLHCRPLVHTVFGDAYLFFSFLEKHGYADLLRSVFPKNEDYERLLLHVFHGTMKTGSKVHCDAFITKSFASCIADDITFSTLYPDTHFFDVMGSDNLKIAFFRALVVMKRRKDPSFGKSCYVDSTPLPNDICDNVFNAFCSHGTGSSEWQTRLVLVLDSRSGIPVWFQVLKGNILDVNTIKGVIDDVRISLDVCIDEMVLDAGYASKDLIEAFHDNRRKLMVKMPLRKGWPWNELYHRHKDKFGRGKYAFVRKGHEYFGIHDECTMFDRKMHVYVYVDKHNALAAGRQFMTEHEKEFNAMKDYEKDWVMVKGGFFILVSNRQMTAQDALSRYFDRAEIEEVFKKAKTYLELLPLSKWTVDRILGKLLFDSMNLIFHLEMTQTCKLSSLSSVEIAGYTESLMCKLDTDGDTVLVDTPSRQTREALRAFGLKAPATLSLNEFKRSLGLPSASAV